MVLIDCEKCGEKVDDAKAFCPACGNSLLEERRRTLSTNFEQMDMTVQLGNTMFNQMLSDMGLNTSKAPDHDLPPEPPKMPPTTTVVPQAAAPVSRQPARADAVPPKASNRKVWIITIVVALVLLFLLLIAAGVAGGAFYYYMGAR